MAQFLFLWFTDANKLHNFHCQLSLPGVTRVGYWIKGQNLLYSIAEIKQMTATMKSQYSKTPEMILIISTASFEWLNIDFKGQLPSTLRNKCLLTFIDEYFPFPFDFSYQNLIGSTVIKCLCELVYLFDSSYVQ